MSKGKGCEPSVTFPIKPPGPPKVWKIVEIKKKDADVPIRFTIQEVPEDRYDEVVEHMCKYFIADEPMCKCISKFVLFFYTLSNFNVNIAAKSHWNEFMSRAKNIMITRWNTLQIIIWLKKYPHVTSPFIYVTKQKSHTILTFLFNYTFDKESWECRNILHKATCYEKHETTKFFFTNF